MYGLLLRTCSRCGCTYGAKRDPGNPGIRRSHGMCDLCLPEYEADLNRQMEEMRRAGFNFSGGGDLCVDRGRAAGSLERAA